LNLRNYTFCNSVINGNYYAWFHDMDSITAIADSNTIPYPSPSPFSVRFYGKRVSNNIGMGIDEMKYKQELIVYPNPSNTILFIECKGAGTQSQLKITDLLGNEVKKVLYRCLISFSPIIICT